MRQFLFVLTLIFFIPHLASAGIAPPRDSTQTKNRQNEKIGPFSLFVGVHYSNAFGGEIGISRSSGYSESIDRSSGSSKNSNYSLSSEFYFAKQIVIAPKLEFWYTQSSWWKSRLLLGGNLLYAFDPASHFGIVIMRPEIGFLIFSKPNYRHVWRPIFQSRCLKINVGYNFNFASNYSLLAPYQISLVFDQLDNVVRRKYP
jgi:hypothetical protein